MRYLMRSHLSEHPRHVACLTLIFNGVADGEPPVGHALGLDLDPGRTTARMAGRGGRGFHGSRGLLPWPQGGVHAGQRLVTARRSTAKRR
jgi:hypothetical protein